MVLLFIAQNGKPDAKTEALMHERNVAARRVDKISRVVFPITFIIFNGAFWIYYAFIASEKT